jgi:hypothetical protein
MSAQTEVAHMKTRSLTTEQWKIEVEKIFRHHLLEISLISWTSPMEQHQTFMAIRTSCLQSIEEFVT